MIKLTGTIDNRKVVAIGLSFVNLDKLKAGLPIHILAAELGIGTDIILFAGKDEDALAEMLKPILSASTIVRDRRKDPKQ